MPLPKSGAEYYLEAKEIIDPKWGQQYDVIKMYSSLFLDETDKKGQKLYLGSFFTENQVNNMYEVLENPYESLLNKDVE